MSTPTGHAARMEAACSLLAEPRRRYLCYQLAGLGANEAAISLDTVARRIAALERDATVSAIDDEDRQLVYVSLVHSHLPALAEYDIVEYDLKDNEVAAGDGFDDVGGLLDQFAQTEPHGALARLEAA